MALFARSYVPSLLVGLALLAPARPGGSQRDAPTARSSANYVRLDVFASRGQAPVADLAAVDFEVLEDNALQQIDSFERISIAPAGPRTRVFVLFLDAPHLSPAAAERLTSTVADQVDKVIAPDDIVAVMTPDMSAANLSFDRKTLGIRDMLEKYWAPGGRFDLEKRSSIESEYEKCFPGATDEVVSPTAQEMIDRRRERHTVDALIDLIRHLTTSRDERKAILVFSEGWPRLKPNASLVGRTEGSTAPPPRVGPGGRPTPKFNPRDPNSALLFKCEADRLQLAQLDNDRGFRWLMDEANNANASFYPIDPREVAAPRAKGTLAPAAAADAPGRLASVRELAAATDGRALAAGPHLVSDLTGIANELSSYYLLGYYSSNTRRDGSFRKVSVRVKREGVDVWSRRGYRAPRGEETLGSGSARSGASAIPPLKSTTPDALGKLVEFRSEEAFRMQAIAGLSAATGAAATGRIWVLGELSFKIAQATEWRNGAQAIVIVSSDGETVSKEEVTIEPGARTFLTSVAAPPEPGAYLVQVQMLPGNGVAKALADAERVTVPDLTAAAAPAIQPALVFRRGPSTGTAYLPTADARFRRNETIRVAAPVSGSAAAPLIRLLGRNGSLIDVPIGASIAAAPLSDGAASTPAASWLVGQTALAPLASGEYVLELTVTASGEPHKVQVPIRVIP